MDELVENGENGYIFKTSAELSKQIVTWFEDFPNNDEQNQIVDKMKRELTIFQESRWEENWNLRVRKFFEMWYYCVICMDKEIELFINGYIYMDLLFKKSIKNIFSWDTCFKCCENIYF